MARSLYRLYLYVVFSLMALLAAFSLTFMLSQLLAFTPLSGGFYAPPDAASVTQSIILASITLLITGGLGGLHYWLIRREQRSDPEPGRSVIRALFLNAIEGSYVIAFVLTLSFAFLHFLPGGGSNIASAVASAISSALIISLFELERRRVPATIGAAAVLQRLHFYGVQLLLLFIIQGFLQNVLGTSERAILRGTPFNLCAPNQFSPDFGACFSVNIGSLWLAALVPLAVWGAYALLTARDQRSLLRQVFHVISFSYAVIVFLFGLERALEYLLRIPFGQSVDPVTFGSQFDFPPILIFGGLAILAYGVWLRADAPYSHTGPTTLRLIVQSLIGIFLSAPFWYGIGSLLYHLLEGSAHGTLTSDTSWWPLTLALLLVGIAYIPTALNLSRRSAQTGMHSPRRGFVLALLAAGALTLAGGVIGLLYTLVTTALGAPLLNWQDTARAAGAALLTGLVLVGVYLWIAVREGVFARQGQPATPVASQAPVVAASGETLTPRINEGSGNELAPAGSLEGVLDELLANTLSRDQAAARIRELVGARMIQP
ncbi:MAG: hypothetical protein ABI068_06795 [Ktedonobacterales bacterium]